MHIFIHIHKYIHLYVYIYRDRQTERQRQTDRHFSKEGVKQEGWLFWGINTLCELCRVVSNSIYIKSCPRQLHKLCVCGRKHTLFP